MMTDVPSSPPEIIWMDDVSANEPNISIESLRLKALASVKTGGKKGDREEGELSDTESSQEIKPLPNAALPPPSSFFPRSSFKHSLKREKTRKNQQNKRRKRLGVYNMKASNTFVEKYSKVFQPNIKKPEFLITIDSENEETSDVDANETVTSLPEDVNYQLILVKAKEKYDKLQEDLKSLEIKREENRQRLIESEACVSDLTQNLKEAKALVSSIQLTEKVLDADIEIKRRSALYLSRDIKKYENASITATTPPMSPKLTDLADLEAQADKARQDLATLKAELLRKKALQKNIKKEKLRNSSVKAVGEVMALSSHVTKNCKSTQETPLDLSCYFPEQLYNIDGTLCSTDVLERISNVLVKVCGDISVEKLTQEDLFYEEPNVSSSTCLQSGLETFSSHFRPYQSPLRAFKTYRFSPYFGYSAPNGGLLSKTFTNKIHPQQPFCPHDLISGGCKVKGCILQHLKSISMNDSSIMNDFACQLQGYEVREPFHDSNHLLTFLKQKLLSIIKHKHSLVVLVGVILDIFNQMNYGNNVILFKPVKTIKRGKFIGKFFEKDDSTLTDLTPVALSEKRRILLSGMADLARGIVPKVTRYFNPSEIDLYIENLVNGCNDDSRWIEVLLLKLSTFGKTNKSALGQLRTFLEEKYEAHKESEILNLLIEDLCVITKKTNAFPVNMEIDCLAYRSLVDRLTACDNSDELLTIIAFFSSIHVSLSFYDIMCASVKTLCLLNCKEAACGVLKQVIEGSTPFSSAYLSNDERYSLIVLFSFIRIESAVPNYLYCAFPFDYLPRRDFFYRLPLQKASSSDFEEISYMLSQISEMSHSLSPIFQQWYMYTLSDLKSYNIATNGVVEVSSTSLTNRNFIHLLQLENMNFAYLKANVRSHWTSVLHITEISDEELAAMIARIYGVSNILGIVKTIDLTSLEDVKGGSGAFDWIFALISIATLKSDCSVKDVELIVEKAVTQISSNIDTSFLLFCLARITEDQASTILRMLALREEHPLTSLSLFRLNDGEEEDYARQFTFLNLRPTEDVVELVSLVIYKHFAPFVDSLKPCSFVARHLLQLKDIMPMIERDPYNIALWAFNATIEANRNKVVGFVKKFIGKKDKQPVAGPLRRLFGIAS